MENSEYKKSLSCQDCGSNVEGIFHTCPYKTEILVGTEDENELCNCCEECMEQCRRDI